jgi:hypothetical protein
MIVNGASKIFNLTHSTIKWLYSQLLLQAMYQMALYPKKQMGRTLLHSQTDLE